MGKSADFELELEYVSHPLVTLVEPDNVGVYDTNQEYLDFTAPRPPHIVFKSAVACNLRVISVLRIFEDTC